MNGPVLRDIHLPSAPWWPLAPGWWALAAVVALLAVGVAWWLRRQASRRPLRAALREVDALAASHAADGDDAGLADGASRLLRRIALRIDPGAAAQTGAAWSAFVAAHARDASTRRALAALAAQRFRAQPAVDAPLLLVALRTWCRDALSGRATFPGGFASATCVTKGADARHRPAPESATP